LRKKNSVALQAFTCNAVVNPILWVGLKPLYIDIGSKTLNISLDSLYERIDSDTKVVVIQHTFGTPVFKEREDFEKFIEEMHSKDIIVIEDCAHCLGGSLDGKKLGTFGDASIFSFGVEKVLSTRVGGVLVVNNSKYISKVWEEFNNLHPVGYLSSFLWLLNPVIWRIIRCLGGTDSLARFFRNLGLLNMGFFNSELLGKKPKHYPRKLSNVLCNVVSKEIDCLSLNLKHRKRISEIYEQKFSSVKEVELVEHCKLKDISFLRYPLICETSSLASDLFQFLKKERVNVGDWYCPVVYPHSTSLKSMNYEKGSCPVAEDIASRIVNLPTGESISVEYAERICEGIICFFQNYGNKRN